MERVNLLKIQAEGAFENTLCNLAPQLEKGQYRTENDFPSSSW